MSELQGSIVLTEGEIASGVAAVAEELAGRLTSAVLVTVVPGGIFFCADLARRLDFPVKMDYISCPHTPGSTDNQSPIIFHDNVGIRGNDVVVVDDALESGSTMKRLVAHLQGFGPASIRVATLFVKPGRHQMPVETHFGYELDTDELVVGYGLPWRDLGRNLPVVARLADGA